jgi:hypothetical protein
MIPASIQIPVGNSGISCPIVPNGMNCGPCDFVSGSPRRIAHCRSPQGSQAVRFTPGQYDIAQAYQLLAAANRQPGQPTLVSSVAVPSIGGRRRRRRPVSVPIPSAGGVYDTQRASTELQQTVAQYENFYRQAAGVQPQPQQQPFRPAQPQQQPAQPAAFRPPQQQTTQAQQRALGLAGGQALLSQLFGPRPQQQATPAAATRPQAAAFGIAPSQLFSDRLHVAIQDFPIEEKKRFITQLTAIINSGQSPEYVVQAAEEKKRQLAAAAAAAAGGDSKRAAAGALTETANQVATAAGASPAQATQAVTDLIAAGPPAAAAALSRLSAGTAPARAIAAQAVNAVMRGTASPGAVSAAVVEAEQKMSEASDASSGSGSSIAGPSAAKRSRVSGQTSPQAPTVVQRSATARPSSPVFLPAPQPTLQQAVASLTAPGQSMALTAGGGGGGGGSLLNQLASAVGAGGGASPFRLTTPAAVGAAPRPSRIVSIGSTGGIGSADSSDSDEDMNLDTSGRASPLRLTAPPPADTYDYPSYPDDFPWWQEPRYAVYDGEEEEEEEEEEADDYDQRPFYGRYHGGSY